MYIILNTYYIDSILYIFGQRRRVVEKSRKKCIEIHDNIFNSNSHSRNLDGYNVFIFVKFKICKINKMEMVEKERK